MTITVANPEAQVYYIHTDHLNTPRAITNQNREFVWGWANDDPFGANPANEDPWNTGTSFTCNLRFPGQYFDRETGLHYNYFRDYDPTVGRYNKSDPMGLDGGISMYSYVHDPLLKADPRGLMGQGVKIGSGWSINQGRLLIKQRYTGSSCGPEGSYANYPNVVGGVSIEDACALHDECYGVAAKHDDNVTPIFI